MKRYMATREIVGHGVAIIGQASVLGSEMEIQRTILVGCLLGQVQKTFFDGLSLDEEIF